MEIHFLELPKIMELDRRPSDALEEWMLYLNNLEGKEMEEIAMSNPGIKKALTIEQIFQKNKRERRVYELREKAYRDELSALAGARAEGEAAGEARGVKMAQEAICKYLEARFGDKSQPLQEKVKQHNEIEKLDKIINKIYTIRSIEEAGAVINGTGKN